LELRHRRCTSASSSFPGRRRRPGRIEALEYGVDGGVAEGEGV
jgi:hypothetical protein